MQCGKMFKKSKSSYVDYHFNEEKKWRTVMDDISKWMLHKHGVCIDMNEYCLFYCAVSMTIYTSHRNLWHSPYFSKCYDQFTIYTGIYLQKLFTACGIDRIWVLFELCGSISVLYLVYIFSLNFFFFFVCI